MVLLDANINSKKNEGEQRNENNQNVEDPPQQHPHIRQEISADQHTSSIREENPEILLKMLIQAAKKLWTQIKRASHFLMIDLGGYQLFDRLAQWCVQHPQMAICLLAAGLVAVLPCLLFMAFAISTIVMTFTGFLVLEGTLLTILTMMMLGLLGALFTMLIFFGIVGVATYFGVSHVYDMYGSTESERTNLRNFMQRRNENSTERSSENSNHNEHISDANTVLG